MFFELVKGNPGSTKKPFPKWVDEPFFCPSHGHYFSGAWACAPLNLIPLQKDHQTKKPLQSDHGGFN